MKDLIDRFVKAIDAEIEMVEEDGRDRTFELRSGERTDGAGGSGGIYVFLLPDAMRLPEDAAGVLSIGAEQYPCLVTAQEGNRLWILVETTDSLPPLVPSARLVLAQTDLLKRLKEALSELDSSSFGMAPHVFGLKEGHVGWATMPSGIQLGDAAESTRHALEQVLGSEVTFLWGPPGTGKTFSIARLLAALVQSGERVLITSHTHAAVEQALWATVEPPSEGRSAGPLHGSPLMESGGLLKVGPLRQEKIPRACHLDSRLEDVARQRQSEVDELTLAMQGVESELRPIEMELDKWVRLDHQEAELANQSSLETANQNAFTEAAARLKRAEEKARESRLALQAAERSFVLGRRRRVDIAQGNVGRSLRDLEDAEGAASEAEITWRKAQETTLQVEKRVDRVRRESDGLRPRAELENISKTLRGQIDSYSERIDKLRIDLDGIANELLEGARGLFATLTKLYIDSKLSAREWDVVIVDEVSMAMPPLVAFAASRARRRVVLVGDFYQLPPIVQSREGIAHEELGVDVFERRGIPEAVESGKGHAQLARLTMQRRMAPEIADVARELVYQDNLKDHPSSAMRSRPTWVNLAGERSPLVVVDLAELRPWAGKLPGTLSRFNFYSGLAAVELSALYAAQLPEPEATAAPPVGVITPYSAQRRYISRIVQEFGLERWVAPGTVHTFQGNECDVIIFDSVLGEPQWTARLTNPHEFHNVRRDLNVAVTRARHQFVFVGDGRWLDKRARSGSAFGVLWERMKRSGTTIPVAEILGEGLRHRVTGSTSRALGWSVDADPQRTTFLDEATFYPSFIADLEKARERVVLYTPFVGKTRWPQIEPFILDAAERGVQVFVLHRPLDDQAWRQGDPSFGTAVFAALRAAGVRLIPFSGIHAKTIVIDGRFVYEGSLNWASHVDTYEHMWRFESPQLAALIERMLQLKDVIRPFEDDAESSRVCPKCGGPLFVLNQADKGANWARQAVALACSNHARDKNLCDGYIRGVDKRAPFADPPPCEKGTEMWLYYTQTTGRPWEWRCDHKSCGRIRWIDGDITPGLASIGR
jgi:hypothetical protein